MKPDYIEINDSEVEPEAPFTESLAQRFVNNPIAMYQRSEGAPRMKLLGEVVILSGSGTWTVPNEVYRLKIFASGGGGGGGRTNTSFMSPSGDNQGFGGSTTFGPYIAHGGIPGANAPAADAPDVQSYAGKVMGGACGGMGGGMGKNGMPGQTFETVIDVFPGETFAYSVGSGGTGESFGTNHFGSDGANGFIYLEY